MSHGPLTNVLRHIRRVRLTREASGLGDGELLERFISQHDEAAFEFLMRRHGPMVLGVCRRVLQNPDDCEDAFQATFLVLVRKAHSLRKRNLLANWLFGVAYRTALKARTLGARRRTREKQVVQLPEPAVQGETAGGDLRPALDAELDRLPVKYRIPVVLCYLQGKTLEEAAKELGWPAGTVSGRLARAKKLLRVRFLRHGLAPTIAALDIALSDSISAAVPMPLQTVTLRAAILIATKHTTSLGPISTTVITLMEGVLRAMWITKLKTATILVLSVIVLAAGAGITYEKVAAQPQPEKKAESTQTPVKPKNRLKDLMKARLEAAKTEMDARTQEFLAGRGTLHIVLESSKRVLKARQEISNKAADQIAALEEHLERMKEVHNINVERFNAGRIQIQDVKQAEYYSLDAEIMLERAKIKAAPVVED